MKNILGQTMPQTNPPAHLAFAPAIFLAVIMLSVYMAFQFVFGGALETLTTDSLAELETRASALANEIVTEVVSVIQPPSRRKLFPASSEKRKQIVTLSEPEVIMDFTARVQAALLESKSSPDIKARFTIDNNEGSPNPVSAKLAVDMSGHAGEKSFASGRIALPKPVAVGGKKAFALHIKGNGLKAIRIAAQERKGNQYVLWEKRDVPVEAKWGMVTIPFTDCDIWVYDSDSLKYTRSFSFSEPENITDFRAFIQPAQITGSSAMLWIDSISLR